MFPWLLLVFFIKTKFAVVASVHVIVFLLVLIIGIWYWYLVWYGMVFHASFISMITPFLFQEHVHVSVCCMCVCVSN